MVLRGLCYADTCATRGLIKPGAKRQIQHLCSGLFGLLAAPIVPGCSLYIGVTKELLNRGYLRWRRSIRSRMSAEDRAG
jgi:hypothetical protein